MSRMDQSKSTWLLTAMLLLSASLVACGGGEGVPPPKKEHQRRSSGVRSAVAKSLPVCEQQPNRSGRSVWPVASGHWAVYMHLVDKREGIVNQHFSVAMPL